MLKHSMILQIKATLYLEDQRRTNLMQKRRLLMKLLKRD